MKNRMNDLLEDIRKLCCILYTVKEKVISEQESEWTMRVYYPYVSDESPVYAEINRAIEEEIAKVCPAENNTISYDLFYEVRCLE